MSRPHRLLFLFLTLTIGLACLLPAPILARPPDSPRDSGFTPLEWVENVASCDYQNLPFPFPSSLPDDYHPLRPYPASPCDPLIPRKDPEAPDDPDQNYLTFSCGKSMNPSGTMTFVDVVNVDILPPLPGGPALNTQYRCSPGGDEVCVLKQVTFDVNLDLSPAKFPILGNTQDPTLTDSTKVNHYLNWYLNGTVQQSEGWRPLADTEIDRLINYSGPVKKLLSRDSQDSLRSSLYDGPLMEEQYHDYLVIQDGIFADQRLQSVNILSPRYSVLNVPLSSNEDITSEVTIGLIPGQQPTDNDGDVIGSSMTLTIGSDADSRLYFPHLRSANALSDLLASSFRPLPPTPTPALSPANDEFVAQVIPEHQGIDDSTVVLRFDYLTSQNTRNTEVIPGAAAPDPLYTPPDQRCEVGETRTNPGDDLVGSNIPATLTYNQLFRYTPQVAHFPPGCIEGTRSCGHNDVCCYGGDCDADSPFCEGPCNAFVCCEDLRNRTSCEYHAYEGCNWEVPRSTCPAYPTVELSTSARIATFVKTPVVERLYDNLVVGSQSLLRRFLPQRPVPVSGEYIRGESDLANTIPSSADVATSVTSSNTNGAGISAGDGTGSPEIFFPHTGSLFDHFMGGTLFTNANLQRALRPYQPTVNVIGSTCTGEAFRAIMPDPLPPPSAAALNYYNLYVIPKLIPEVVGAYQAAEEATGVPCEILAGIHHIEAGNSPDQDLQSGAPLNGRTLTESAIQAAQQLLAAAGGNIPDLETMAMAMSYYNGGSNRNCQDDSTCAPTNGFPERCGATVGCATDPAACACNPDAFYYEPGSCRNICGNSPSAPFPYTIPYAGSCPAPYVGYDDPYVTNWWISPDHDSMYLLFRYDCTQTLPEILQRPGSLTVAIILFQSE